VRRADVSWSHGYRMGGYCMRKSKSDEYGKLVRVSTHVVYGTKEGSRRRLHSQTGALGKRWAPFHAFWDVLRR
jgi:hypothetical protein